MNWNLILGMIIMGTTGAAIGFYIDGPLIITLGAILGGSLGACVSIFGGRWFFLSILAGTILGGALALYLEGPDLFVIGAGSGGAIGGFIGINIEQFASRPSDS